MYCFNSLNTIYKLANPNFNVNEILYGLKNSIFEYPSRKYLALYQYKISNKYTDEEIYQIFSPLDNTLVKEEIALCGEHQFIFYKIILEPMIMAYNSDAYNNMIQAYLD